MAYYISGHGKIEEGRFKVPEGSTIVVMARPGELMIGSMHSAFCDILPDVLVNPNTPSNRATLVEHFGSLAFYPAGSWCPNFAYKITACYGTQNVMCEWIGSGVIPIERLQDLCSSSRPLMNTRIHPSKMASVSEAFNPNTFDIFSSASDGFKNVNELSIFLQNHVFQNSVLPSADEVVKEVLERPVFRDILRKYDMRDRQLIAVFDALNLEISQSELCSRMPGFYFNFVCRPDEFTHNVFEPSLTSFRGDNYSTKNPRMTRRSLNRFANIIRRQIEEAEFYRKPAIRNWARTQRRMKRIKRIKRMKGRGLTRKSWKH